MKYSDIFSDNKIEQAIVTKLLEARYKKRKKLVLEKLIQNEKGRQTKICHQVNQKVGDQSKS